ncbi:hypothetical protein Q5P01_000207 [Channa striata]|uniref:Protein kinase domain-containing protein n=1 Tax=Channa striata TaxID=64152 RepID=A0AA88IJ27_CHASR|nr:hypothetical protein Q5P01_000207 [Channa striata]
MEPKDCLERLMELVEAHHLYHVKTLDRDDARGVLRWMGAGSAAECAPPAPDEDAVSWLRALCDRNGVNRDSLEITRIDAEPNLEGKERLVVCIERRRGEVRALWHCGSLVLFDVIAPGAVRNLCGRGAVSLCRELKGKMPRSASPFVEFASHAASVAMPRKQASAPVLNGLVPKSYDTVRPKTPMTVADGFAREHCPKAATVKSSRWTLYTKVNEMLLNHRRSGSELERGEDGDDVDIGPLLRDRGAVLGRGGFGVTVRLGGGLVAKVNLFPEMVDWSVPFVNDEFQRYAHVASQMEEILTGVSIKHPNVLRTFGGFWCEAPGYGLGGRAVAVMEMAVCSLHEFALLMDRDTRYVPLVELDTLNALDYLRGRAMQHRDITHRNILVCRANGRKPMSVSFKISDFGTACNFSTPDQPRGTRTNRAPEVLWCLEADTGTDVFSWYCVMWELYSGTPLVGYRAEDRQRGFCRKTYAKNLSELVGVYTPRNEDAFRSEYMKGIHAEELWRRYSNARPSVSAILEKLSESARTTTRPVTDREFIALGPLCITLFPQERYSPSELLSLPRYRTLQADASPPEIPRATIPLSVSAGEYRATDVVTCDDCAPKALLDQTKLVPVTAYRHTDKEFYGVDVMRLAPGRIQPYAWYASKASSFAGRGAVKRKAELREEAGGVKVYVAGSSDAPTRPQGQRSDPVSLVEPESSRPVESRHELGDRASRHLRTTAVERAAADERAGPSARKRAEKTQHLCRREDSETSFARVERETIAGSAVASDRRAHPSGAPTEPAAVEEPQSRVFVKGRMRRAAGEIDTGMAILVRGTENEEAMFMENVVELSQTLTEMHPGIFAGPSRGLCKCSASDGVVVFQYALLLKDCTPASEWTPSQPPHSKERFVAQVLLLLREALLSKCLPVHALDPRNLLICQGAVVIDAVGYLSRHFRKGGPLVGECGEAALELCVDIADRRLPGTTLGAWLKAARGQASTGELADALNVAIESLGAYGDERIGVPDRLTLDQGLYFTFKEYTAEIPTWLAEAGEGSGSGNWTTRALDVGARLLVYGTPPCARGDQADPESLSRCGAFNAVIRNLVLRLKAKVLGETRLEIAALNCTSAPLKVTVNRSALTGVSGVDELDRARLQFCEQGKCYMHDANPGSSLDSLKWAPVIMFSKHMRTGPLRELSVEYYKGFPAVRRRLQLLGGDRTANDKEIAV